jgi:hypothetical protein
MIKTRTVDYYPSVPGANVPTQYGHSQEGVPNPYRNHLHNWRGGPLDEGNLYHGPNYYEPQFRSIWQPRPLWGIGGGADMYRQDVRTRNGVFANQGYGGGIFNSNVALGADTARVPDPTNAAIWGMPDPRFAVLQGKLNTFLVANGISMIVMDGVLGESFCAAGRSLVSIPGKFEAFLASLSQAEMDMATFAIGQCVVNGYIKPDALPCGVPGSTNPSCGGGGVTPPPGPVPPSGTCPAGQALNQLTGQCVAIPVPTTTCPTGQLLNPLTGQCMAMPTPLSCPAGQIWNPLTNACAAIPPIPAACPAGQVSIGGKCIPLDVMPKTCPAGTISVGGQCIPMDPNPTKTCPAGTTFDASTGLCKATAKPAAASSSNAVLYIVGGVAAVGLIYFATRKRK